MATRSGYPGTITTGDTITAANNNNLPGGWIGHVVSTADQGSITTDTDLTAMTVTVTIPVARRLLVGFSGNFENDTADAGLRVDIKQDGVTAKYGYWATPTAAAQVHAHLETLLSLAAGTYEFSVSASDTSEYSASGTVTFKASTGRADLWVIDVGPQT